MIFQQFNLVGRLDVLTNVLIGRLNHSSTLRSVLQLWPEKDIALALSALEQLDIAVSPRSAPISLSGGQQQRVAIARALVQEPEIILADEPIASLDPRNTRIVMDALLRINRHLGITVLCNLHSLELARAYCDRLVGMANGRVVFEGAPGELTDAVARELYGIEAKEARRGGAPGRAAPLARRRRPRLKAAISHSTSGERDMHNRRTFVIGSALAALMTGSARAQDWKAKYPELVFAVIPPRTRRASWTAGRRSSTI